MRTTRRRGFTLIEIIICIVIGSMLCGMIAMTMRISVETKRQRNDLVGLSADANDTLDIIERLLQRAVELPMPGGGTSTLENFQSPSPFILTNDNDVGIQFFADADPIGPGDTADRVGAVSTGQKYLEWVWIWTDRNQTSVGTSWPYERRYPVKVAIFRSQPSSNNYDQWTKPSGSFYGQVNSPTGGPKPYLTIGSEFASLSFRVQRLDSADSQAAGRKRVTITGGVFPDRSRSFPAWGDVAPGAGNAWAPGYPGGISWIPTYTLSRTIVPRNLNSPNDPFRAQPWAFHPQLNRSLTVQTEISYTSDLTNPSSAGYPKGGAPYLAE